jgi:hypothetical protein
LKLIIRTRRPGVEEKQVEGVELGLHPRSESVDVLFSKIIDALSRG